MSCPTTRRFARSMAEAFPRDHAQAIEHYTRRATSGAVFLVWLAACMLIGVMAARALVDA